MFSIIGQTGIPDKTLIRQLNIGGSGTQPASTVVEQGDADRLNVDANLVDANGSDKGTYTNPIYVAGDVEDGFASNALFSIGGIYRSSAPTYSDGQYAQLQVDSDGNLKTTNNKVSFGAELTIFDNGSIGAAGTANSSRARVTDAQIAALSPTFVITTACTDYTVQLQVSHDDVTYATVSDKITSASGNLLCSADSFSAPTVENYKIVITNNDSSAHNFTVKTTCYGATMASS